MICNEIRIMTKLPNSEQSYKGKVKTHNYIYRQNQSTTGKLWRGRRRFFFFFLLLEQLKLPFFIVQNDNNVSWAVAMEMQFKILSNLHCYILLELEDRNYHLRLFKVLLNTSCRYVGRIYDLFLFIFIVIGAKSKTFLNRACVKCLSYLIKPRWSDKVRKSNKSFRVCGFFQYGWV